MADSLISSYPLASLRSDGVRHHRNQCPPWPECATAKETASPLSKAPKASYPAPLRRYIAHHKSLAVQEVLLSDARTAKEVAVFSVFAGFRPHDAVLALSTEEPQDSYRVLEAEALRFAKMLGFEIDEEESLWPQFPPRGTDDGLLYAALKTLSDHDLERLLALLTALSFGQSNCERLDTGDSLFNDVARDLNVRMRSHWQPDAAFLSRRTQPQLVEIAKECGYAEKRSSLGSYKKSELVQGLLKHFDASRVASEPSAAQVKAREWLPGVMCFPAIDPDAAADHGDETGDSTDE